MPFGHEAGFWPFKSESDWRGFVEYVFVLHDGSTSNNITRDDVRSAMKVVNNSSFSGDTLDYEIAVDSVIRDRMYEEMRKRQLEN